MYMFKVMQFFVSNVIDNSYYVIVIVVIVTNNEKGKSIDNKT